MGVDGVEKDIRIGCCPALSRYYEEEEKVLLILDPSIEESCFRIV